MRHRVRELHQLDGCCGTSCVYVRMPRAEVEEKTEQLAAATSAVAVLEEQVRQAGAAAEAAAAARAEVDAALEKTVAALQAAEDRCEAAEVRVQGQGQSVAALWSMG